MVQVKYLGLRDPKAACEALKPYRQTMIEMGMTYRPRGPQYTAIQAAVTALDDAIGVLTGDRSLLHLKG